MSTKSPAAQRRVTTTASLFRDSVARLIPNPDDVQRKVINTYALALTNRVDRRRRAKSGKTAVGFETLSATATALFGAALAELGFGPAYIAPHGAEFGVAVRGLVASA
ncbi:MAG TPA: hypothetical protein VJM32_05590 [Candidatus Saccharimonadales bacterium]|nr:hypothetical protein [Candidatus Saccharimonadales bacterium]